MMGRSLFFKASPHHIFFPHSVFFKKIPKIFNIKIKIIEKTKLLWYNIDVKRQNAPKFADKSRRDPSEPPKYAVYL
jgi:hypothetical protein